MILPYPIVKARCKCERLVEPAVERSKAFGMSYGYSAAGYDIRAAKSLTEPSRGFALEIRRNNERTS